ncbi:uncharacterized protein LOC144648359 [Oculina patagonica]
MPQMKKNKNKKSMNEKSRKKVYQLLEKLYYEQDRPSALGGVEKLYRVARQHGIKRKQVLQWLQQQPGYTLHKPARKRFTRNRVFVNGLDQQWQCDLCDVSSLSRWNRGHKYILTCIDVLSKYAWAVALKTKTGSALVAAFTKIFQQGRKPEVLQSDAGTEFKNKTFQTFLKKHDVRHFVTYNETKAQIAERFNKTLKQLMWRMFTTSSTSWIYKFNVGDQVKISKYKKVFEKGYLPSWTEETFTIGQRLPRNPPVYRLKEANGDWIQGTFYEAELQKVIEKADHLFRIEKILKSRGKGKQKEVLVLWKGWPRSYASWLPSKQLVLLQQA